MNSNLFEIQDQEQASSTAFARPISSSTMPLARWERKAKEKLSTSSGNQAFLNDRFITSQTNTSLSMHNINNENISPSFMNSCIGDNDASFKSKLAQSLFEGDDIDSKILACKKKAPKPSEAFQNNLRVLYTANKLNPAQTRKAYRHISKTPERILDAPDLMDDYYLNLMDWSVTNVMAVALGPCVYLWDPSTGGIELLFEADEDLYISSLKWMSDGSHIAMGMSNNEVLMWDANRKKQVRCMKGHSARVGALAWNNHILSSGSRDSSIFNHDVRIADHHVQTWNTHTQEICGLSWSPDGSQLASGGNDNVCCIWDASNSNNTPRHVFQESHAAVKALAWSPHERNLLATGSGTADRHIRFYDTLSGNVVNSIDTGSQVCSLIWNKHEKEILSSHGFSENQLTIWKYPTMAKVTELTGHTSRVLHTALSADGTTVCSAAADETLRFWKVFEPVSKSKNKRTRPMTRRPSKLTMSIR